MTESTPAQGRVAFRYIEFAPEGVPAHIEELRTALQEVGSHLLFRMGAERRPQVAVIAMPKGGDDEPVAALLQAHGYQLGAPFTESVQIAGAETRHMVRWSVEEVTSPGTVTDSGGSVEFFFSDYSEPGEFGTYRISPSVWEAHYAAFDADRRIWRIVQSDDAPEAADMSLLQQALGNLAGVLSSQTSDPGLLIELNVLADEDTIVAILARNGYTVADRTVSANDIPPKSADWFGPLERERPVGKAYQSLPKFDYELGPDRRRPTP